MINPIPFLSLLNASLSASPSISTPKTVDCYDRMPSGITPLSPITFKECREAVARIPTGEKSLAPITWARNPDSGFEVPAYWKYGNCVIAVDVARDGVTETESFANLLKTAFDLTITCTIRPPHLGGKALLGKNKGLEIYLYGERIDEETRSHW